MKVVLDTNVIVSGLLNPYGVPGEIVRLAVLGSLEVCYDARILSEYREVLLRPKFNFSQSDIDVFLTGIKISGHSTTSQPLKKALKDPDDEAFLEVALASNAKYLVTGNLSDYQGHGQTKVAILSPAQFMNLYRRQ